MDLLALDPALCRSSAQGPATPAINDNGGPTSFMAARQLGQLFSASMRGTGPLCLKT
jgi:hypothetical protein